MSCPALLDSPATGDLRPSARPQGRPPDRRFFREMAGGGRSMARARQTGGVQNQPSGAKGFAVLVGIMCAIVLVLMAIAVIASPH